MLRRTLILSLTVACAVWVPATAAQAAPAKAKRTDASAHFDAAAELYAREDYAGAASEFAIAYALDPQVDTLFAWAQAERLAQHYEEALELYERLLAGELSAKQREAVQTLRFQVQGELEIAQPKPTSEPDAPEAPATDQAPEDDDDRSATPDGVGVVVTGVGAGLTVLAGGLLIGAALTDARVRAAQTYPEFEAAFDPQSGRGRGAVALYASGGVLAVVGLTTLIVGAVRLKRARHARSVAVAPALGRDQLGLVVTIGGWR